MPVPGIIFRAFSRHLVRHPWQLALAALGITIGVAVIVAIRLTQFSAVSAFDTATRATTGPATHRLQGTGAWIAQDTYRWLTAEFPSIRATPVIRRHVVVAAGDNPRVMMLGIDPISRLDLAPPSSADPVYFDIGEFMTRAGAAVTNAASAAKFGLTPGRPFVVTANGASATLVLVDTVPPAARPGGLVDDVVLVDIATAQEVLRRFDAINYIDLHSDDDALAQALREALTGRAATPAGGVLELIDLREQLRNVERMTSAFYANLTALSLMALLVGMFLIYNTETFLVVQRRHLFGRLRALGAGRGQILAAVLAEAAVIGALGSVAGLAVGYAMATSLLAVVSTTLNDLYFESSVTHVALSFSTLAMGFVIGITATLIAAFVPAWQAARVEPNIVITRLHVKATSIRTLTRHATILCVALLFAAALLLRFATSLGAGFIAIGLIVIAFAMLCPPALLALSSALGALPGARAAPERLGCRSIRLGLNRTAPAAAALMVATAASIGIGVMVTSFRVAVTDWLDSALRADLYIADSRFDNHQRDDKISPDVAARLRALPAVAGVSSVVRRDVGTPGRRVALSAFALTAEARSGFRFTAGDPDAIWRAWGERDVVLVTEPYAYHHAIAVGDEITLLTDRGERRFEVAGIYLDYASERGNVAVSRATFERHWQTRGFDGLGVYAHAGIAPAELRRAVDGVLAAWPTLLANSPAELKQTSLKVFDRTFLITDLLRVIAVAVSFIGVLGALLAQQLERTREYGSLRALGLGTGEMLRLILTQTLLLGSTAAILAIPVGILVGIVLIDVINPRSFGWTMGLVVPPSLVWQACAVAIAAALVAGLYPSYRASRIEPAIAMRYE